MLVSGGGDSVCLLDVAVRLGARVSRAARELRAARGGRRRRGVRARAVRRAWTCPSSPSASTLGGGAATSRSARATLATRWPSGWPRATTRPRTRPPTRPRRCSTGWRSRPARARCTAWRRGAAGWCGPLLGVTREEVREYLRSRGLEWREDPSNADRRFARARVRHDLMEALRSIGPAAERTIAETARQLREEAEVLDAAVDAALEELGGGPAVSASVLGRQLPAVRRLVLRRLAERAGRRALRARGATRSWRSAGAARSRSTWAAGCARLSSTGRCASPARPRMRCPTRSSCRCRAGRASGTGRWRRRSGGPARWRFGPSSAPLLTVRAWRDGDRMRPVGLGGTKTLQDLFTDRKVPRALRRTLPVVESDGTRSSGWPAWRSTSASRPPETTPTRSA